MDLTHYADEYWAAKDDSVDEARLGLYLDRLPAEGEVLVVDGGPGMLAALIARQGRAVRMTDLSAHAVERARAKGLDAVQVDTDDEPLPFEDARFSCVISDSAIEHRYWPERAVKECIRVLEPGGTLLLLVPNAAHWRYRLWLLFGRYPTVEGGPSDRSHLRHFALPELKGIVRAEGLRIESVAGWPSLWVKGLYPSWMRAPGVRTVYAWLTRLRPSLFGRDLLIVARKGR